MVQECEDHISDNFTHFSKAAGVGVFTRICGKYASVIWLERYKTPFFLCTYRPCTPEIAGEQPEAGGQRKQSVDGSSVILNKVVDLTCIFCFIIQLKLKINVINGQFTQKGCFTHYLLSGGVGESVKPKLNNSYNILK